jgi:hypothetical protein
MPPETGPLHCFGVRAHNGNGRILCAETKRVVPVVVLTSGSTHTYARHGFGIPL